jgi:hypothetical protein
MCFCLRRNDCDCLKEKYYKLKETTQRVIPCDHCVDLIMFVKYFGVPAIMLSTAVLNAKLCIDRPINHFAKRC